AVLERVQDVVGLRGGHASEVPGPDVGDTPGRFGPSPRREHWIFGVFARADPYRPIGRPRRGDKAATASARSPVTSEHGALMSLKPDQDGRGDTTDRPPTSRAVHALHEVTTRPLIAIAVGVIVVASWIVVFATGFDQDMQLAFATFCSGVTVVMVF